MDPVFFLKGTAIGLGIAAPVGPIGILCIRRTLRHGAWSGFVSGLGAATADAAYGGVAAFGLTAVSAFLVRRQLWLGLIGGAFLGYLGVRAFLDNRSEGAGPDRGGGLPADYGSTLLLTLSNPATILSFAAVFAGFGLGSAPDYWSAVALVLGVFVGSSLWWCILSGTVGLLRSRVTPSFIRGMNRASGCVLLAFGIYAICRVT
ncbi:MAG TPA: LysE family translocator [Opitutaceae bacterium]